MNHPVPRRILIVRPDTYGDLILFDPVLRLWRQHWPETEIGLLVQERYLDLAPLIAPGIQWLATQCDPYRESIDANPRSLEALQSTVTRFAPDCVVAACSDKTWMEAAVAHYTTGARHVSLGAYRPDPITEILLRERAFIESASSYSEIVEVGAEDGEWERNLRLAAHLLGVEAPSQRPQAAVPEAIQHEARAILAGAGLEDKTFIACCPAGTARVSIKTWPAERFGEVLAWLQKTRHLRPLVLGHQSEREIVEKTAGAARRAGANPVMWLGADGQFGLLGGLLACSRLYLGNDTGALHLAAALGKPVVSIFGGGHWPRFKPASERAATVVQPLPCFGCAWDCLFGEALCVTTIPVAAVKKALQNVLGSARPRNAVMQVEDGVSEPERNLIARATAASRTLRDWSVRFSGSPPRSLRSSDLLRLIKQLEFSEADRAARMEVIHRQGREIAKFEQDSRQWADQLARTEADRAARLEAAQRQLAEVEKLRPLARLCADQSAEIKLLHERITAAEADRGGLREQLERVRSQLAGAESELQARQRLVSDQSSEISRLVEKARQFAERWTRVEAEQTLRRQTLEQQAAAIERLQQVDRLCAEQVTEIRLLREQATAAEVARAGLETELRSLREQLAQSERDRAARLAVIEKQGAELGRVQSELKRWFDEVRALSLKAYEADKEKIRFGQETQALQARTVRAEQLAAEFKQWKADAEGRLADLETLRAQCNRQSLALQEFQSSQDAARVRIKVLQERLSRIETSGSARLLKLLRLWPG